MSDKNVTSRDYFLNSMTYDSLKSLVQLGLPAAGTLYFTLSSIWGFPYGEQVVGTLAAINTFLGVILRYSSTSYKRSNMRYDGNIVVTQKNDGAKTFSLEFDDDPSMLDHRREVTFKINSVSEPIEDTLA